MLNPDSLGHTLMTIGHIMTQVGTRLVSARNEDLTERLADAEQLAHDAYALGRRHEREGTPADGADVDEHQGDNPAPPTADGHQHQGDNPADGADVDEHQGDNPAPPPVGEPPVTTPHYAPVVTFRQRVREWGGRDHQDADTVGAFTD